MAVNISSIKTSSDGVWQGDNPLHSAFPLLIAQTILILAVSRSLAFLLKPLRQPKVIAEIVGGIVLGPSVVGRNKAYLRLLFPPWSTPVLESVASIGLLFFLFLVGLELDLASIRRSGRRAFTIAAVGISLPFAAALGVSSVLRRSVPGADRVGFAQHFVFMGVALSITAFPVLARILAELKLLTTPLGETTMAAAAFNDLAAWILLALAVALAGGDRSPLISLYVLLSGGAFVAFVMIAVRPAMRWVARRAVHGGDAVDEAYICVTLAAVMGCGFLTDLIGIHSIFGAFVLGLAVPKGGEFGERLIERIEDLVGGLLLPLYFASSGLKTDVAEIRGWEAWGLLGMVVATACAGKILGTFAVAVAWRIPAREALTLGVLMNTKGLVELIVLNIGKEKKVLNDETFAILVLMAIFTTFVTTPVVMAIYKPARRGEAAATRPHRQLQLQLSSSAPNASATEDLRILACVHGPGNVPALINFIESTRSADPKSLVKLYVMRLMELTERSSSIMMVQRARRNGLPFINLFRGGRDDLHDQVAIAFQAYGRLGRVSVHPATAISPLQTMHEDICHVAEEKMVTMIVLLFHRQWQGECEVENMGHGWRGVNQRVLKNAPCSVALLVDRGFGIVRSEHASSTSTPPGPVPAVAVAAERVCVLFFGGPDDREALELGGRMAEHPAVKVTVIRFVERGADGHHDAAAAAGAILRPAPSKSGEKRYCFSTATMDRQEELDLDKKAVAEFQRRFEGLVEYEEREASNVVEEVLAVGRCGEYELVVVGKGRFPSSAVVAGLADRQAEHAELGPIGDVLASSASGVVSSVLVIQQHDLALSEEAPASRIVQSDDDTNETPNRSSQAGDEINHNIV